MTRSASGQWTKGVSGNPGGRPRIASDVREALEAATPRAVQVLVGLLDSADERIALRAAEVLLNRTLGPPGGTTIIDDDTVDTVDFVPVIVPGGTSQVAPKGAR
jgi:hypothetical protein